MKWQHKFWSNRWQKMGRSHFALKEYIVWIFIRQSDRSSRTLDQKVSFCEMFLKYWNWRDLLDIYFLRNCWLNSFHLGLFEVFCEKVKQLHNITKMFLVICYRYELKFYKIKLHHDFRVSTEKGKWLVSSRI